jgi:fluoride exporter
VTVVLVLLGGAVGAPVRYLLDLAVQSRHSSAVPWGTITVNVVGSFLLGAVAAAVTVAGAPTWLLTLVGAGFCGALTTFSAFGFETVRLLEYGAMRAALLNVVLSLVLSFTACTSGWALVAGLG